MKKQWNVTVNGIQHNIEYKTGFGTKLIVDGEVHKLKSQNPFVVLIDCPIIIDGAEVRVVVMGNKADIAVNGEYVGSHERYIPVRKVAAWANVLLGLSCIGGWLLCGVLGLLLGVLFGVQYIKLNLKDKNGGVIGFFIFCTAIQVLICWLVNFSGLFALPY